MRRSPFLYGLGSCFIPGFLLVLNSEKLGVECYDSPPYFLLLPHSRVDSILTEKQYFATLHAADEITFKNEFETEFLLLLDNQQRQVYDSLSTLAARKAYIEQYWQATNPNPLLPENDWLKDYLQRRAYARKNFPYWKPPYFDDRGKHYLKYGKPALRYQDPGGYRRIIFLSPERHKLVQKFFPLGLAPDPFYMVGANESWSYENVRRDFVVNFIQEGTIFREVENLTEILTVHQRKETSWQWSDLIKQRTAVSPIFARAARRIDDFEKSLAYGIRLTDIQSPTERIFEIARAHAYEMNKAKSELPSIAHDPIEALNQLSFYDVVTQFRNPDGSTRVVIALLAPLKENFIKRVSRNSSDTLSLEYRCLMHDHQFNPVVEDQLVTQFPIRLAVLENFPNAVGKLIVLAPPQQGDLTLQVKDERNGKIGFSRRPITIRDFRGDSLMISDIQFLTEALNENQKRVLPVTEKQNRVIAPYPFEKIRKSIPLLCYFEVYNLKSSGLKDEYEIVYKIISEKRKDENILKQVAQALTADKGVAVSVSYTRPITGETAEELIGIDLSRVTKGNYRLEIIVTDTRTKTITVKAEKGIIIVD